MTTKKRKARRPIVIETHGVHVRLFKRGATWWLDVQGDGVRDRKSAKTDNRVTAEDRARALAEEIAKRNLLGVTPDTLTLGQLFAADEDHKGSSLDGQWKTASQTRQRLFLRVWGYETLVASISQTSVDAFAAARRTAYVARQRTLYEKRRAKSKDPKTYPPMPEPRALRDGALDCDFRWLSSVFNFAVRHRTPDGKRLLGYNPLKDCKRPREKKDAIRRPIASHDRFTRTLEKAATVDPMGRFRVALVLARYTARRIDAVLHLSASDLLLSTDRVRAALAGAGRTNASPTL